MHESKRKHKPYNPKGDLYLSSSINRGFFKEEQEFEGHLQESNDIMVRNKQQNALKDSSQIQPESFLTSRRKKTQSSTPLRNESGQQMNKSNQLTGESKSFKNSYKRNKFQLMNKQIEILEDEDLIVHDQILFSKPVDILVNESISRNKSNFKYEPQISQLQEDQNRTVQQNSHHQNQTYERKQIDVEFQNIDLDQLNANKSSNRVSSMNKDKKVYDVLFAPDAKSQDQQQQQNHNQNQNLDQPQPTSKEQQDFNKSQYENSVDKSQFFSHIMKILTFTVAQKMVMKTNIEKISGFFNFHPQYHVYFQADKTHLMSAKRVSRSTYSTFVISSSKTDFDQKSPHYLGKAKGSVMGDQLDLFGPGLSPSAAKLKKAKPRQLMTTVIYETRIIQSGQPRDFTVYVKKPQVDYYQDFPEVVLYEEEIPLNVLYRNPHNRDKIIIFKNKKPEYVNQIRGYTLNFNGRAGIASVKNFILGVSLFPNQNQPICNPMLFGKVSQNIYNMDIGAPLSPFIAFGIALSSFDEKFFCE